MLICTGGSSSVCEGSDIDPDGKTTTADAGGGASSAIGGKSDARGDDTIDMDLQQEACGEIEVLPPTIHLAVTTSPSFRRSFVPVSTVSDT